MPHVTSQLFCVCQIMSWRLGKCMLRWWSLITTSRIGPKDSRSSNPLQEHWYSSTYFGYNTDDLSMSLLIQAFVIIYSCVSGSFVLFEPQKMLISTKADIFPTLQNKMGSLFKPMLPLTHIHEQEPSIKCAKLPPPSQTDSSPYLEFPPTTPLFTNGEPVWVSHTYWLCVALWLFFIVLF